MVRIVSALLLFHLSYLIYFQDISICALPSTRVVQSELPVYFQLTGLFVFWRQVIDYLNKSPPDFHTGFHLCRNTSPLYIGTLWWSRFHVSSFFQHERAYGVCKTKAIPSDVSGEGCWDVWNCGVHSQSKHLCRTTSGYTGSSWKSYLTSSLPWIVHFFGWKLN